MMHELKGLGVAMVTPFSENGNIDYAGLERLVKHLHKGADYLVVMGTTGESATLTDEEKAAVLDFVAEINAGKLPIVYGLGGNNTKVLAGQMRAFEHKAVQAFLSVSPYYNRPSQEGIYLHYLALSEASKLPIIAYNVPARTGSNLQPETVLRIANDAKKVVGIKEAASSIDQVMKLAQILPPDFLLLNGDDALCLPHMVCGGHGMISVVGNAYPKRFGDVLRLSANGDWTAARKMHYRLLPLLNDLFKEGNPGGIKEVLKHLGICSNVMRLPLAPVSKALSETLYHHIAEIGES
jgi:4-hydroxy-tetrahydrodipicolinate synthase